MLLVETSSGLEKTRTLVDRLVCELSGFVDSERRNDRPNLHLLTEWECHLVELQADLKLLCGNPTTELQAEIAGHAAALVSIRAPKLTLWSMATTRPSSAKAGNFASDSEMLLTKKMKVNADPSASTSDSKPQYVLRPDSSVMALSATRRLQAERSQDAIRKNQELLMQSALLARRYRQAIADLEAELHVVAISRGPPAPADP